MRLALILIASLLCACGAEKTERQPQPGGYPPGTLGNPPLTCSDASISLMGKVAGFKYERKVPGHDVRRDVPLMCGKPRPSRNRRDPSLRSG